MANEILEDIELVRQGRFPMDSVRIDGVDYIRLDHARRWSQANVNIKHQDLIREFLSDLHGLLNEDFSIRLDRYEYLRSKWISRKLLEDK